jgi:hypothetical protein
MNKNCKDTAPFRNELQKVFENYFMNIFHLLTALYGEMYRFFEHPKLFTWSQPPLLKNHLKIIKNKTLIL